MKTTHYTLKDRHHLPNTPGIYQFYNVGGTLIYVGKAKNLKKRVNSYFKEKDTSSIKTRKMVAQIHSIGFVLVNTEYEALLLENNLIKQNQPRYNVLLKDSKTYPYLCVTKERFPRIIITRQCHPPLGRYFGPFTDTTTIQQIQTLIRELYPLRTCSYNLSEKNILKKKFKVCLEYHIHNCLGPCAGLQTEATYKENIDQVILLLKGHFTTIKKTLKTKMLQAAKELDFEKAESYKQKLAAITRYQSRSLIAYPTWGEIDVMGIVADDTSAYVSYLRISRGRILFAQTVEIRKKLTEASEDLMAMALCHFRKKAQSKAHKVLTNVAVSVMPEGLVLIIPKMGDKKKLVELAVKNAFFFKKEVLKKKTEARITSRSVLMILQQDLRLKELPMHIECFDNSNLQGTNPVAAMVCFKKGQPVKRAYRHFHIKTVVGPDDFASMHEVITRRYQQHIKKQRPLPDLIVIDGGKGQLSAATSALKKLGIYGKIAIISIAKKLETIYYPEDPHPLYINKKSPSLQLLQRIRDEAHRFAITFHRQIRSNKSLESRLEAITGIGPKTINKLLTHFGSLAQIKEASLEALTEQVGKKKTAIIRSFFT